MGKQEEKNAEKPTELTEERVREIAREEILKCLKDQGVIVRFNLRPIDKEISLEDKQ